jgi:hypothetical protein
VGDRGTINFTQLTPNGDRKVVATIYTHWYGSDADEWLREFFADELSRHAESRANTPALVDLLLDGGGERDLRWHDPSYLAARFVAWASRPNGLGIGIAPTDGSWHGSSPSWIVECDRYDREPVVRRGKL